MNGKQNIILLIGFILMLLNLWWGSQGSSILNIIRGDTSASDTSASTSTNPVTGEPYQLVSSSANPVAANPSTGAPLNPNSHLPGFPSA